MTSFRNVDPASGELISDVKSASDQELASAVLRAREAQPGWEDLPIKERAARLVAGAKHLEARVDEIASMITREMGKPNAEASREVAGNAARVVTEVAEIEEALAPQLIRTADCETEIVRAAHGVVAAITPWNFPVGMPMSILLPALCAGNTVVWKPSEQTAETGRMLAEALMTELPSGVLELVQGAGDVGAKLVAAEVDMIGFVGSREAGMKIMTSAGGGLKRLVLELGGKDPLIVFDDADLEAAADVAVRHALRNTGQVCCSVERIYVADGVADRFEALVVERAKAWKHGSGFDGDVKMGPLVSAEQRDKVVRQVDDAVARGARLLLGGALPTGPGYFYPATVLSDVSPDAVMSQEETFGPVVALSRFDGSESQAIAHGNATSFGLGANVFTADVARGRRVAKQIHSGQVGINRYLTSAPGAPWVGARQSGFGFLGGPEGHRQFTIPKTISYPTLS